jgi:Uma2 family endonuclease
LLVSHIFLEILQRLDLEEFLDLFQILLNFRSPDVAWIPLAKWESLTPEQQEKFLPICPDFVIELRSPSDSLKPLQDKMQEYIP